MKLIQQIYCLFGFHEWTCNADQNIKATQAQINNGIDGFWDYAKMYCKHCKTESKLNSRNK